MAPLLHEYYSERVVDVNDLLPKFNGASENGEVLEGEELLDKKKGAKPKVADKKKGGKILWCFSALESFILEMCCVWSLFPQAERP